MDRTARSGYPQPTHPDLPLAVHHSRVGDTMIVAVVGEIDMATTPEFEQALRVARESGHRVVVNLSGVGFLDTCALNTLLECQRILEQQRTPFQIVGPATRFIRKVFEIGPIAGTLNILDSLDAAMAE
jgi:anti-sigma B factor antagonist